MRALVGPRRSSSAAEAFLAGGVADFLGTLWPVGAAAVLAARPRVLGLGSIDRADCVHCGSASFPARRPSGHRGTPSPVALPRETAKLAFRQIAMRSP